MLPDCSVAARGDGEPCAALQLPSVSVPSLPCSVHPLHAPLLPLCVHPLCVSAAATIAPGTAEHTGL